MGCGEVASDFFPRQVAVVPSKREARIGDVCDGHLEREVVDLLQPEIPWPRLFDGDRTLIRRT